MTVNISYMNEMYSVMLSDAMISNTESGRQSNNTIKSMEFKTANYHGSICGAGSASVLNGTFRRLDELLDNDFKSFTNKVNKRLSSERREYYARVIENKRKEIESEVATLYAPSKESCQMIVERVVDAFGANQFKELVKTSGAKLSKVPKELLGEIQKRQDSLFNYIIEMQLEKQQNKYNQVLEQKLNECEREVSKSKELSMTSVLIDAYDKKENKLRRFYVNDLCTYELNLHSATDGSGRDGADFYFLQRLQGADPEKMSLAELIFHVGNAYAASTINRGVGGTPTIHITDKDNVRALEKHEAAAITNVCGAANAGIIKEGDAIDFINVILKGTAFYDDIANKIGMHVNEFKKATKNPNEWFELKNAQ